jgi:osmoprotectant transport system permease protein
MNFWEFVDDRREIILFQAYQNLSMVVQSLILAAIIGVGLAALLYRYRVISDVMTAVSAVGLTVPSFALLGFLIVPMGTGVTPPVVALVFYGCLPIFRNALVGLSEVDPTLVEAARGMGLSRFATLIRIELPVAWPVILTGMRISGQLMMGISAIAAYVSGPGLGGFIFSGLARIGGANATNYVIAGTFGILVLALILDACLVLVRRLTTPRGIRV